MTSSDIFEKNWSNVHTSAIMQRVQKNAPTEDTIVVKKEIFNELVEIANVASKINSTWLPFDNIEIKKVGEGYEVSLQSKVIPKFSVEGRTIVEALSKALIEARYKTEQIIN